MKKVFPAVRAQARVVDLPYPGPLEQKPVGALQVEKQPVTTSLEHGALEARLLKSLSHVLPNLVAAGADAGPEQGRHALRVRPEGDHAA